MLNKAVDDIPKGNTLDSPLTRGARGVKKQNREP